MSQLDFIKYLMQNKKAQNSGASGSYPAVAPQPQPQVNPTFKGGGGQFNGSGASATVQRPVAPAVAPNAPAVAQQAQASVGAAPAPMPMKDQSRMVPGQLSDKGGRIEKTPDHWKAFRQKAAQTLLTPGYHDKERGIWVNPATAIYEQNQRKAQTNKTRDFLVRKGYSLEDADAIVAGGSDAIKTAMTQVKAPKSFDKRGFEVVFEGGKAFAKDPNSGELSPAQFRQEEVKDGKKGTLEKEAVKDVSRAISILDDNESGTFSSMVSAGDLAGLASSYLSADTPYGRLDTSLKGVRAQTTVESMKLLRDQSSNGATGLGQITEKELNMLQNMRGSLDTWSSPEQLRETLVELHDFKKWVASDEYQSDGNRNNFEAWRAKNGFKGSGSSGGSVDSGWSVKEM